MPPDPPLVRSRHVLGQLPKLAADPLTFLVKAAREYGDVSRFRLAHLRAHLVASPDGIRHVLQENHKNYNKQTPGFEALRLILGNGLLTSEGDFWLRQRRIAQPAFHKEKIAKLAERMTQAAIDLAESWAAPARDGKPIDVARQMMRVTLRIVGETLLSSDVTKNAEAVGDAISFIIEDANSRITSILDLPPSVPTRRNRRFKREMGTLDEVVLRTIAERRAAPGQELPGASPSDLLTMLMEAKDEETGEQMSDAQLRDEVMTMFLAGHETTANLLTWTFYLLSKNPGVQRELARELHEVLGGEPARLEHAPALRYTKMVLNETMRLYPPAWVVARRAIGEDVVGSYRIAAGSIVFMSPYVTQRHPGLWDNPEGFDPERFRTEKDGERPRFAFFPFGGGPHLCIGNSFAMLEAQILLATLAQKFRLDLVPGLPVVPEPLITLRPRGGMRMTVHRHPS
jgi:cytochrome P450